MLLSTVFVGSPPCLRHPLVVRRCKSQKGKGLRVLVPVFLSLPVLPASACAPVSARVCVGLIFTLICEVLCVRCVCIVSVDICVGVCVRVGFVTCPFSHSGRVLSWNSILSLAFNQTTSPTVLGRMFSVSRFTASRAQCAVALSYLRCQDHLLLQCAELACAVPVTYAVFSMMWDETGEKLALGVLPSTSQQQKSSSWEVLVATARFAWGWVDHNGVANSKSLSIVIPPLPIMSCSSKNIHSALFHHPVMKVALQFKKAS